MEELLQHLNAGASAEGRRSCGLILAAN